MCKIYTVSELNNKLFIRLTGKWLEEKGFNKGDKFRVFSELFLYEFFTKYIKRTSIKMFIFLKSKPHSHQ